MIIEDLRAFVVVAQHGSFSQAAADLCMAQSGLSKRVQRLEQRMGTSLFERRSSGVVLTQKGRTFLARAQRLVDEVDDLERNLSSFAETPTGEVRIALPQRTCSLLAPPLIERCWRELPLVKLTVMEGTPSNVHGWLMRGETDIAMTYSSDIGTGYTIKPFLTEPLFLFVASHKAADYLGDKLPESCAISDLATLPLILPGKPNVVRVLVDRLCVAHGIRPNITYEADGPMTLRAMVDRGLGTTLFSLSTSWSYGVESGQLMAFPFSSPLVNWKMYLACTRRDVGAIAVNRVYEIVTQELDQLLHSGAWSNAKRIIDTGSSPI